LNIYPEVLRDATAYNWQTKRKIFLNSRLYVASPSRWLMNKVEASILAPAVIEARVVPNGVDMKTFRPTDKREARAVLGVRSDARVLLTMGVSPSKSRWKDYQTLREASSRLAERLKNQDLLLIVVGEDAPPDRIDGVEIKFVPFQRDPQTIARYHQAADIYVHPALADTFPNAVLEAQACGIPVIATAVGGIPEQVENGKGGFLVPSSDPAVLADRITQLLSQGQLRDSMGRFAARYARRNFDLDSQVKAYLAWYHELALTKATSSAIYR
jgi:glycosyltransferase involved in cell wall biosynthesis